MEELRSCPLCGGEAELCHNYSAEYGDSYWIGCKRCLLCGESDCWQETVVKNWNRRVPDIVRCGECKYFLYGEWCGWWDGGPNSVCVCEKDYCSFGERRESEGKSDG